MLWDEINFLALFRMEPRLLGRTSCGLVAIVTVPPQPPHHRSSHEGTSFRSSEGSTCCQSGMVHKDMIFLYSTFKSLVLLSIILTFKILNSGNRKWYLYISPPNKLRSFPYTTVSDWVLQLRLNVFTVRYELNLELSFRLMLIFKMLRGM